MPRVRPSKRLDSENEVLLPAWKPDVRDTDTVVISGRSFVSWTFGRGSVIYRIWLAVLLYTLFATAIAMTSINRVVYLGIPTVMMTVLGVVIGFVISYRASSGYDRYWMGKTGWEDVIKNSRTLGRLIWFHVPLRLSPKTAEEIETRRVQRSEKELNTAMAEKYMALDLTEGFSIALKHHLRGELGKHYEDLYHLIKPLHNHGHATSDRRTQRVLTAHSPAPYRRYLISAESAKSQLLSEPVLAPSSVPTSSPTHFKYMNRDWDPIIPPINAYGTFDPRRARVNPEVGSTRSSSRESLTSTSSSMTEDRSLLPANPSQSINRSLWGQVSGDLVPFSGLFNLVALKLGLRSTVQSLSNVNGEAGGTSTRPMRYTWHGPVHEGVSFKHRPRVAGGGQNLPLDILRRLSEWMSELEDRETVPGTTLGQMMGTINAFEDSLTALERILTTPLPFVYSAHIKHTIWIYLFFLPFQLVHDFGYYSIPGVAIASFIYLGFLAAGEEIEQPFGYDENDLDLDLFCQDIIHADMERLKTSPCLNARFGPWQSARAKRNIRPESHEAGTSAHYAVTVGVSETLAENE